MSHYYDRQDLPLDGAAELISAIEAAITAGEVRELAGHPVTSVETLDGLKVNLGPDR